MRPSPITLVCLGLSFGVFAACLWPYNFVETNRVSFLTGGGGVRFEAPAAPEKSNPGGILFTPGGLNCRANPGCEKGSFGVDIRLKAATETSGCIKRIVDLRAADGSEALFIGQWKAYLIARSSASGPASGRPYQEIGLADVLLAGKERSVAVTSNTAGSAIYLDGRLAKQFPGIPLLNQDETLAGRRLYLGNSPDLSCPWAGEIYELALYGRRLASGDAINREDDGAFCHGSGAQKAVACYRLGDIDAEGVADLSGNRNDLSAARRLYFDKPVLHLTRLSELNNRDFWLNVAGFIPMGFIYFFRQFKFSEKSAWLSAAQGVLIGSALSLAVELTQAWLPTRDSSMADLIANTAGAAMGAVGGILWVKRRRRPGRIP